jgi:hypothetical protein
MKYVIDIPDSEETMWEGFNGDLFIPITMNKGTKTWVNTDLKITPYTEPDKDENLWDKGYSCGLNDGRKIWQDENRQKVEQEVWEFASEFYNADREVETLFSCDLDDICKKYTYSEAKAKYDAWKKEKDEIQEYDEIISEVPDNKAVIVRIDCWGQWHCVNSDGIFMVEINQQGYWRKTGRSFPELGDVLKKMEE